MAKGYSPLENEAAQSTTALGPLVGLAREDFVGAIALLLRETASDPARTVKHMRNFGEDMVQIMTGKSEAEEVPAIVASKAGIKFAGAGGCLLAFDIP